MSEVAKEKLYNALKRASIFIGVTYFMLCGTVFFMQESFVFVPTRGEPGSTPKVLSLPYEDLKLKSGDGEIHAWFIPAKADKGTILFCHGNAGNLGHRISTVKIWNDLGYNLMIFDYRGFGISTGSPSEENCYEDTKTCYEWLKDNNKLSKKLIIHGRSLGGGPATWAALNLSSHGLILESTFTSIPDMGRKQFPILPVDLITYIEFPILERVSKLTIPLLVLHSKDDEFIPYSMAERLAATGGVELQDLTGDHNSGFTRTIDYKDKLEDFISTLK